MAISYQPADLVTVIQAAKALNITKCTMYRWVKSKAVDSVEIAGHVFIPKTEVEKLQKQRAPKEGALLPAQGD